MKTTLRLALLIITASTFSGCWLAVAGAGAEAGYVLTQEDRTAGETLTDQRITSSVKTKLLADSLVSGFDINVDTFKSTVTLKGVVETQEEVDRAVELAASVKGVQSVQSKLYIDGHPQATSSSSKEGYY